MPRLPLSGDAPRKRGVKRLVQLTPGWHTGQRDSPICGRKTQYRQKLTIGSWNVRTLLDLNNGRSRRRTALIAKELSRYNIDIAALSETGKTKRATDAEIKRQRRHERALALANRTNQQPEFARRSCGRKLAARIGQLSHERACARKR